MPKLKHQHGFRVTVTAFVPYDKNDPASISKALKAVTIETREDAVALLTGTAAIFEEAKPVMSTRKLDE